MRRLLAFCLALALLVAAIPVYAFSTEAEKVRHPVIFIPGLAGSQLFDGNELVWINTWRLIGSHLPGLNLLQMGWLLPLRLASDGVSPYYSDSRVKTGDIMRHSLTDIYGGFVTSLKQQGYEEGKTLHVFPYDWRQDPSRVAGNLGAKIDQVLKQTGARQVVLIGHSLGGLVARDYIVHGGASKVKATISLATPWLGAPLTYRALEYGWDMGMQIPGTKWSALAPKDLRTLSQNYPSVYSLAPARAYFAWYPEGYIVRAGRKLSYEESLQQGLATHNRQLALGHSQYLDRLLDGSDHGVKQYLLAGRGRDTTAGFNERKDWLGMTRKTEWHVDGDGVVPLLSADAGHSRDPVRARTYLGALAGVVYADQPHTMFTQSQAVQETVAAWLAQIK